MPFVFMQMWFIISQHSELIKQFCGLAYCWYCDNLALCYSRKNILYSSPSSSIYLIQRMPSILLLFSSVLVSKALSLLNTERYHIFQNRVNQSEMRVVCLLISPSLRVSSVTCLAGNNLHFRRVLKYEVSQFLPNYYIMRAWKEFVLK